jgi:TM2 domain-containing membrane protein YozV
MTRLVALLVALVVPCVAHGQWEKAKAATTGPIAGIEAGMRARVHAPAIIDAAIEGFVVGWKADTLLMGTARNAAEWLIPAATVREIAVQRVTRSGTARWDRVAVAYRPESAAPSAEERMAAAPAVQQPVPPTQSATFVGMKDGGTAAVLSFLWPGAGQLYTGEVNRGLAFMGGSLLGATVMYVGFAQCLSTADGCSLAWAGLVGMLAVDVAGIVDAPASARRMNEKRRAGLASASPFVAPTHSAAEGGGARIGLALRF